MLEKLKARAGVHDDPAASIDDTPTARLRRGAFWVTVGAAGLTVLAALNLSPFPTRMPAVAAWLHPLVAAVGAAAGWLTMVRARELEAERWRVVADPDLTSGERQYAHKEAEREVRSAASGFLVAALAVAVWLAYQLRIPGEITVADLLVLTAALGFLAGLGFGVWRLPRVEPDL